MKTHTTAQDLPVVKQPRRRYSAEFKRQVVEKCNQPNTSIARVALEHGMNANLIHKWIRAFKADTQAPPAFVPIPIERAPNPATLLSLELPSLQGTITVHWPMEALADLAPFLKVMQQ